jgi:hypothetical protein
MPLFLRRSKAPDRETVAARHDHRVRAALGAQAGTAPQGDRLRKLTGRPFWRRMGGGP